MKTPSFLTILARIGLTLAALFLAQTASAQSATGMVEGRVFNTGTGKYLNNARVAIEGTSLETQTNEFGSYRINGVPAGPARVRVVFTGLDPKVETVTVLAGQAAQANFELTSVERYGKDQTVQLDVFKVAAQREFEGSAIAINEQRYAPNVKVVMAADAFGDVTEGNVGEFLKYLPGITVDYVAADVRTVSVRGFADTFTNVSVDGMRMTSSVSGNSNRVFEFEQVSINNMARVEVAKVPTPDTPSDSLGGSINMISKNAFERKGAQFNYRGYLSFNSEDTDLFKRTPGPGNKSTFKVLPGFDFDYTLPVSDTFGLVITGLSSNQFNEQHRWQTTWNHAQAGATQANPYLQQWQVQDGPKNTFRDSVSIKADWKIGPTSILSVSVQDNYYKAFFGNRNLNFNIGTNAASAIASGTPLQWGQTFVQSATGTITAATGLGNRATVTQGSSWRHKLGDTKAVNVKYTFKGRLWDATAGIHGAKSKTWYRELARGHFSNIGTQLRGVSVVRADNINFPAHDWSVRDTTGAAINPYVLSNYNLNTAQNSPVDGKAKMKGAFLDLERHFTLARNPLALKFGGSMREEDRDNRRYNEQWTFVGADRVANTADDNAAPFLNDNYLGQDTYYGEPPIQWVDAYKLANYFRANPTHFVQATGTAQPGVQAETNRINGSEKITERITAGYVQLSGKLLDNRLLFVTGVRWEKTEDTGLGVLANPDAVFQRTASGAYVDGDPVAPGVQRIRRADAGTAGSLQELTLTRVERGYRGQRSYDDFYPSLHLTYNISANFLARFAYARTLGRPDYADIIPNADINENDNDPNQPGTITIRNTGLKPWTAHNFDLSFEYYPTKGGVAQVGFFDKELQNFWGLVNGPLTPDLITQLGLDNRYLNWTVSSRINAGDARISGMEFNYVQPLKFSFLPEWAKSFSLSSNGTMLHLEGANGADFRRFISKSGNVSLSWNKRPISARLNWNYRGRQKNQAVTGAQYDIAGTPAGSGGFNQYYDSRYNVDVNVEYTHSKRLRFFANARNILNQPQTLEQYSPNSAHYAHGFRDEEFGVQYSIGVKGSF
ncbi:MAG: TonB-dependent receptor [Opitutaceae bacterium]|nr:TonB-dependent receptor [Opitutaceae bacterium]